TPMQWSPDRNAGFSRADPQRLYLPPIMDAVYGYEAVNVEAQSREPASLLNWMKRLLAVRQTSQAFGRGKLVFLRPGNRKILAYLRELDGEAILCVANLGRSAQPVELDLARFRGRVPVEMIGRTPFPPIGELPYLLTLPACGFYWFHLATDAEMPHWHEERAAREDLPVLVLFDGWTSFFRDRVVPWRIRMAEKTRAQLEYEVLPRFVEAQRWYPDKGERIGRARLAEHALWESGGRSWLLAQLEVEAGGEAARYFAPLALAWEDGDEERMRSLSASAVAKVRQQASVGLLGDAFADEAFCRAVLAAIEAGRELPSARGRLRFAPTAAFTELAGPDLARLAVGRPQAQSSNTVVTFGERLFLKGYRRLRAGVNPELEVGRFLTEVARFPNCAPVAGAIEFTGEDGAQLTLALLQAYVPNQGDGWNYTLDYLDRFLEAQRTAAEAPPADAHGAYLALAHTLGTRTAELHRALAVPSGDPAFDPEPLAPADFEQWKRNVHEDALATLALVERRRTGYPAPARDEMQELLARRDRLLRRIDRCALPASAPPKTRYHGDFHLGQVLVSRNDFVIIDFEGEPARPLAERRLKHSPLRDVAGMLRSFDYARWTALRRAAQAHGDSGRLEPLVLAWLQAVQSSFLQAYDKAIGGALLQSARGLLELFELEKALYELRYEIGNRPGWVRIPLLGILALTE
ncbi:MAG: putative maltokinase, partial [Sphingomonadaceae bacterium]